jgi:hypothetical protein
LRIEADDDLGNLNHVGVTSSKTMATSRKLFSAEETAETGSGDAEVFISLSIVEVARAMEDEVGVAMLGCRALVFQSFASFSDPDCWVLSFSVGWGHPMLPSGQCLKNDPQCSDSPSFHVNKCKSNGNPRQHTCTVPRQIKKFCDSISMIVHFSAWSSTYLKFSEIEKSSNLRCSRKIEVGCIEYM